MAQFQPISLSQSIQLPSQQSVQQQQQQQQQQLLQQNPCQYQLEPCDIKPQFSLIPSISQSLSNNNNMNITSSSSTSSTQGGIGNVGALMTTLDNVVNGINNVTTGQFVTSMNHADVASLLMNPSKRAETFVIDEVKVMLKEIEARKHILLSLSPSTNRLKRRAWEEVAVCMANRWPHAPRRTADQVKKKWENLVSKTKRKVRAGHVTPELDWNETNAAVMQFLTQHSPPVRLRYLTSTTPSLLNLGNLQSSSSSSMLSTAAAAAAAVASSSSSINCTNGFNHMNSNNYGLSNSNFLDSYNNNNMNSSIFPNNQQSSFMLSNSKSNFMNSNMNQDNKNSNNNNNNNSNSNNNSNNNTGQLSFSNHDTNKLNSSTEENDVDMTNITNIQNNTVEGGSDVGNITGSVHESFLSSFSPFNQSFINFGLPSTTESFYTTFSRDIQKELYLQLKQEHELRMDILRLQKQTWLLQMNLFKKMKIEQISSLFSSPSLMMNTTCVTPLNNTNTTTPITANSTSTPSVAATTTTTTTIDPVSSINSNCTTSLSLNTTTVTNETIMPTKSTKNKEVEEEEEEGKEEMESQCIISNSSLSPMFPQDGTNGIGNHDHQQENLLNDNCRLNNKRIEKQEA
ncbi:unnamed protein product [Schistosoma margrebowiei]|uniref:Myb/SANT-like DNA-binding domain-containing protein n=1 Tax=Schistosoma margrebowiei TaxID=48269 RepID=A0AA85ALR5_9TREM|nr:unnamed protein product [Schistosoma margrebowiei]